MNHGNVSLLFICIHIICVIGFMIYCYKRGWLRLDHQNLFQQKLFWISIFIPLTSFLLYGVWSWQGHTPDLSASGFETFYNISKFPLLLLASSVPLASIVNNIHRTIQTEKQIKESEKKNLSDSYYTHFKNTLDLFKNIQSKELSFGNEGEEFLLSINNPVRLYNNLYKNSSYDNGVNYKACEEFKKTIKDEWDNINLALGNLWPLMVRNANNVQIRDLYKTLINLYRLESSFEKLCKILSLGSLTLEPRPIFRTSRGSYVGLFYSDKALSSGVKELDKICLKIFDIAMSDEDNIGVVSNSSFLNQNIYLNYNHINHLRNGQQLLANKVSLRISKEQD